MLFNSLEFIVFFLPLVLFLFFAIAKYSKQGALVFLLGASAFFIGFNTPAFLYHILSSLCINYLFFQLLMRYRKKAIFIAGVAFNLIYLFYFKYYNFSIETLSFFLDVRFDTKEILLPLAISFYTFQQVSFLHDALKNRIEKTSFINYAFFVLFFPQLIAGPIIRHNEFRPAFSSNRFYQPDFYNLSLGISLFTFGLFKKVVFADSAGKIADSLFGFALTGESLYFFETWLAIFAFSFQIYFDFSGYSDMAVGLGRCFNVKFPQNFNSPYQATSLIDFWRRWHISLSSFLKENVYIPLGGSRRGKRVQMMNLLITMLLGGLWHGASWTFVVWGALHGFFLIVNHLFPKKEEDNPSLFIRLVKQIGVFLLVGLAWIFFRAETFSCAFSMFRGALGFNGISMATPHIEEISLTLIFTLSLFIIVLFAPNTFDWHFLHLPSLDYQEAPITKTKFFLRIGWRPNLLWAPIILILLFYSFGYVNNEQEFIYFQF